MVFTRASSLAVLAALTSNAVHAFTVKQGISRTAFAKAVPASTPLFMAEDEKEDTTFVSSVFKKEIAYDEKSGRFFETGYGEGECIPDEEFCITDNDSGEMIRLTIEEKERIFLDALQVRRQNCCRINEVHEYLLRGDRSLFSFISKCRPTIPAAERCLVMANSIF